MCLSAVSLRINGPVHKALKCIAKRVMDDVTVMAAYVQDVNNDIAVLTNSDLPAIRRLVFWYVQDRFGWSGMRVCGEESESIIKSVTHDRINKAI